MKIIYCYPNIEYRGGIERVIANKANYLVQHNCEVCIVTTDQRGRPNAFPLDERVKCYDLDINYSLNWNRPFLKKIYHYFMDRWKHKRRLASFLKEQKPDIVVSAFRQEETILPQLKDGSKKIVEFHFSRVFFDYSYRKGWHGYLDKYHYARMVSAIKKYDKFILLTHEDEVNWKGYNNIEVIPNAQSFQCEQPAPLEQPRAIAVGRYVFQKGFDRLIEAWKIVHQRTKGWTLHIVGDGELRNELQAQIDSSGLKNVVFLDGISTQIKEEYVKSSFLVCTSHFEGLPMMMLEAESAGLPIVSFACPCGPRDLIKDGDNGFLVSDGDIEGLAERIIYLIEHPQERKEMGRKAFEYAGNFSQEKVMAQWMALFDRLVKQG